MTKQGEIYKYLLEHKGVLIKLAKKYSSYQNSNIDTEAILSFLLQLESLQKIKFFIKILENIDFLTQNDITILLEIAYKKANINTSSVKFFPLGSVQDSSAVACYRFFKSIFDNEKEILKKCCEFSTIGQELDNNDSLEFVFIDDNITSGTQLEAFFAELFNEIKDEDREMVKKPLTDSQLNTLKKINIKILYAVKLSDVSNKVIVRIKEKYKVNLVVYYGKEDLNNYLSDSSLIDENINSKDAEEWIKKISVGLFKGKKYSPNKINDRLIGYGNLAKLTIFSHNTPKSLITPLWRTGEYLGINWLPLFPEFNESKIIKEKKIDFPILNKELSYLIFNGKAIEPSPKLVSSVHPETISIPSRNCIRGLMKDFVIYLEPEYNTIKSKNSTIQAMIEGVYAEKYDTVKYDQYLVAIKSTNQKLELYYKAVEDYLLLISSKSELVFELYNSGDIEACNITLETSFNTMEFILTSNSNISIPKPNFEVEIPKIADYKNEVRLVRAKSNNLMDIFNTFPPEEFELNTPYSMNIFENVEEIVNGGRENKRISIFVVDDMIDKIKIPYNFLYRGRKNEEFGTNLILIEKFDTVGDEKKKSISQFLKMFEIPDIHNKKTKYLNL